MGSCTRERFTGCTKQKGAGKQHNNAEGFEATARMSKKKQRGGSKCLMRKVKLLSKKLVKGRRKQSRKGRKKSKKGKKSKK